MTTSRSVRFLAVVALLLFAAACGGSGEPATQGGGDPAETAPADDDAGDSSSVSIADNAFDPAQVTVSAGATVEWTNEDDVPHTVTFEDEAAESSETLNQGDTHSATFDEAGEYPYICKIHPSMTGTVTVS